MSWGAVRRRCESEVDDSFFFMMAPDDKSSNRGRRVQVLRNSVVGSHSSRSVRGRQDMMMTRLDDCFALQYYDIFDIFSSIFFGCW